MKQHYLVRPQHLNHHETLFGGQMMAWADEAAFLAASITFPRAQFVTKATEPFNFNAPVKSGDIVEIEALVTQEGNTSCKVSVNGRLQNSGKPIFDTTFVMVSVNEAGKPTPAKISPFVHDHGKPFIQQVIAGYAAPSDIDLWIEAWHKHQDHPRPIAGVVWSTYEKDIPLHQALGMTETEYGQWVENPNTLQTLLDKAWRKSSTKNA